MKINFKSQAENKLKQSTVCAVMSMILIVTMLAMFPRSEYAQTKLTLGDIFTGLRSKKVDLEERNKLLTEAIKSRGVTFSFTPDIEKELQETGADKELIEAIKQRSVIVKTSATPMPVATPAPMPVATPAATPAPPDFSTFQKKGDSNFVKGDYDSAVINYSKAIDLNPKESSIYLSRGLVYYNRKFYDLAIADYGKAIEIDPKEMMAYYYRGDSFEKLGELQKAADDYKKVVELDSSNENAKANVQRLEAELKKNQPKDTKVTTASNTEATSAPAKTGEAGESPAPPLMAELGSLVEFAVKLVQPIYPAGARTLRVEGSVLVNVTIDEEGNPIFIKAASGHTLLRQAAEDAVKRSKFRPAMVNNQPTKAKGFITFKFRVG